MTLLCGIIGLANIGKSTLFNSLTSSNVSMENYPFCTIEPNIGCVNIPDKRLLELSNIVNPKKITSANISFIDIAGLIKGASNGDGLGNKFLSHIRNVDAICHVVKCFKNREILDADEKIDPMHDVQVIETELILADCSTVSKICNKKKKLILEDKKEKKIYFFCEKLLKHLDGNNSARTFLYDDIDNDLNFFFKNMNLLSSKPVLFVANIDEESISDKSNVNLRILNKIAKDRGTDVIAVCAKIENELNLLNFTEKKEYLIDLGIEYSGFEKIIKYSFKLLDMITYFTVGESEIKAWILKDGSKAPKAAGVIHSDFERGFIKADVIWWMDFIKYKSEFNCRQFGAIRLEGKDYIVKDGDIMNFKFNV